MNKRIAAAIAGVALSVTALTAAAQATPGARQQQQQSDDNTRKVICKVLEDLGGLEGVDVEDILDTLCKSSVPTTTTTTSAARGASAATPLSGAPQQGRQQSTTADDNTREVICKVLNDLSALDNVDLDDIMKDLDCDTDDDGPTDTP